MDLVTKTDIEIKALIYDAMVAIENAQKIIKVLNAELSKRNAKQTSEPS